MFKKQAENVKNYLSKGSLAGVDGRLQTRSYENKVGQRVFVTEVVADSVQFLEPKNNNQQQTTIIINKDKLKLVIILLIIPLRLLMMTYRSDWND